MITIEGLTKRFGAKTALDHVSFTAEDGMVTGFLGPNGAGKSTTMRAALGLITPDSGSALIDGRRFVDLDRPMAAVGAVLDAKSAHKGRSAYAHLLSLAQTNGIPRRRVDEVVDMTGLAGVNQRRAGTFSLGMSQRLSIAAALLGDPRNLVLDEPINGLDPEGVKWVRELCQYYAGLGRAVLLSSHLMSEVALTADNLVIIGQGRILETTTVSAFVAEHSTHSLRIITPEPDRLRAIFASSPEVSVTPYQRVPGEPQDGAALRVTGADLKAAADVFARAQLVVYQLVEEHASLEDAYMALTHASAEYRSRSFAAAPDPAAPSSRAAAADGAAGNAGNAVSAVVVSSNAGTVGNATSLGAMSGNAGVAGNAVSAIEVSSNTGAAGNAVPSVAVPSNAGIAGNAVSFSAMSGNAGIAGNAVSAVAVSSNTGAAGNAASAVAVPSNAGIAGNAVSAGAMPGNAGATGNAMSFSAMSGNAGIAGNTVSAVTVSSNAGVAGNAMSFGAMSGNATGTAGAANTGIDGRVI